ncbi:MULTISPECIES: agmatinase [Acidianus]|uniref:Agmatinase n=1 Tax=Candidatus Acidianus copahuensis TaxID=1160895 RepID=A0A031LLW7_9CREN|nr:MULTISPECIES: agmatinase [Acidianus]EZQ03136.1 agmatinase [Candidatus Acidianus copahuensis]NON62198.1 agmatinase [Acidianus sp. RZ1]
MSDSRLLYLNENSRKFAGFNKENSPFVILGLPMDITSSYRPGSRFAPSAIREASQYIEFYSLRADEDMGEIGFNDAGDVVMHPSNVEENVKRIRSVASYFAEKGKILISIGGEHTVSIGTVLGTNADCVISFDAHLDLREEYMGYRYDHACVMRRLSEEGIKIMEIGNRAISREEIQYANSSGIRFITTNEVNIIGIREVAKRVINFTKECSRIYLSYDMDSIDPSYAPGVATPEPEGLSPTTILDTVKLFIDRRIVAFDVVEVSPSYDPSGITSVLGSKLILETSALIRSKLL